MKIQTRPLSGTRLVEAWLREDPDALGFFPGSPAEMGSYLRKAEEIDRRFGEQDRSHAAAHLVGGGAEGASRLQDFVANRGFMVTTGQQPGLFGGPLYGLYKGLTAAALARRLERALGRPVLPVFWIASEDHSCGEVCESHVLDVENGLHEVALPPREDGPARPFYRIRLGEEIEAVRDRFLGLHPDTDFSPRWRSLLERAYRQGTTLPEAFQAVMEELLGPAGVFLVQAHDPGLKVRSLPTLLAELRTGPERDEELRRTGAELQRAGYDLQVPLLKGAMNLFLEGPHGRERLFSEGTGFRLRGSEARLSLEEVEERAREDPSLLSPNVLLRPVVESVLLPTLSYVAGPGEVAYLPQTAPVFRSHGVGRPVVHPRVGLVVLERKVEKVLDKFGLELDDMVRPHHELAGMLVREEIPAALGSAVAKLRQEMDEGSGRLLDAAIEVDPTLRGTVEAFRSQGLALLEDVEKKVVQSVKREHEIALAQVAKAQAHLFPLGRPQERVLNPFYYLVRYDEDFVERVWKQAEDSVLP